MQKKGKKKKKKERKTTTPTDQRPHSDMTFVMGSAIPTLVTPVTDNTAPAKHTARTTRMQSMATPDEWRPKKD